MYSVQPTVANWGYDRLGRTAWVEFSDGYTAYWTEDPEVDVTFRLYDKGNNRLVNYTSAEESMRVKATALAAQYWKAVLDWLKDTSPELQTAADERSLAGVRRVLRRGGVYLLLKRRAG